MPKHNEGISGAKGRNKRPQFDRMLKAVTRGKIDVVAAWSVDRLDRSFPELVAFLGDLLFHGRFPWLGDCDLDGLIAALGRVLALDIAVVVPGHGPPATLADVARFRDMLAELRGAVDRAIKTGVSEEAAVAEVALPQYAHIQRYAEWMPLDVRAAYRYLRGS